MTFSEIAPSRDEAIAAYRAAEAAHDRECGAGSSGAENLTAGPDLFDRSLWRLLKLAQDIGCALIVLVAFLFFVPIWLAALGGVIALFLVAVRHTTRAAVRQELRAEFERRNATNDAS